MKHEPRVLIVEDEQAVAELVAVNLRHDGLVPIWAPDGAGAQRELEALLPDAILLDWNLPDTSGVQLARRWRSDPRTRGVPIVMLTARSAEADKVAGLDAGADDYVTKPFSPRELLARIRAVLRRTAPEETQQALALNHLSMDLVACRVCWRGGPLPVGPTEFKLLHYLLKHPERVHTRAQLRRQVWGERADIEERTVDVHIKRLRDALGPGGVLVETVRGTGYRISAQPGVEGHGTHGARPAGRQTGAAGAMQNAARKGSRP